MKNYKIIFLTKVFLSLESMLIKIFFYCMETALHFTFVLLLKFCDIICFKNKTWFSDLILSLYIH